MCYKSVVILKIKRAAAEEINIYTVMDDLEICKSRRMGWFQRWSVYHNLADEKMERGFHSALYISSVLIFSLIFKILS